MKLSRSELKDFLEEKADQYNNPSFIASDPVSVPHLFSRKEDIEISGFLTATLSWGNRAMILRNSARMMELLDNSPYEFVMGHSENDLAAFRGFVHRTFNSEDLAFFVPALRNIYENHGGPEKIFAENLSPDSIQPAISAFRKSFLEMPHQRRSEKHIPDPSNGSAAKRINMFLRIIKVA